MESDAILIRKIYKYMSANTGIKLTIELQGPNISTKNRYT